MNQTLTTPSRKLRVLLVQQDMGRRTKIKPLYPIGLAYLAGEIEATHTVKIFDPNLYPPEVACENLSRITSDLAPNIIGISIKYIDTTQRRDLFIFYNSLHQTVSLLKKICPQSLLVAGGPGFSLFPHEIMTDIPAIDFGILHEGERSFAQLLKDVSSPEKIPNLFYRNGKSLTFTKHSKRYGFENIAGPTRNKEIIDFSQYIKDDYQIFGIQTKRGCPYSCAYCNYPSLNGRELRLRSPHQVVDEIEFMVRNHGLTSFTFVDNIFNSDSAHAQAIQQEIIERNLSTTWSAWFDLKNLSPEYVASAVASGCRFFEFSPDAATTTALSKLGKGISPADITRSFAVLQKHKQIFVAYNFFCSHPWQTFSGFLATCSFFARVILSFWGRGRVGIGWIRIQPNTKIREIAVQEKSLCSTTPLFAQKLDSLAKLFYRKPSLFYADWFFFTLLAVADYSIKPFLKILFFCFHKKYPFYRP